MSTMKSILYGGALAVLGVAVYLYFRYRKNQNTASEEKTILQPEQKVVEGTLNFADVVAWFKGLQLNKDEDTPFVANLRAADTGNSKIDIKSMLPFYSPLKEQALFLGVYHEETEKVTHALIIEADALDDKTKEVIGEEFFVVLG